MQREIKKILLTENKGILAIPIILDVAQKRGVCNFKHIYQTYKLEKNKIYLYLVT